MATTLVEINLEHRQDQLEAVRQRKTLKLLGLGLMN